MNSIKAAVQTTLGLIFAFGMLTSKAAPPSVQKHLERGEFQAAQEVIATLPIQDQADALGDLALSQAFCGNPHAASRTLTSITDSSVQSAFVDRIRQGASGGNVEADFESLMELITSTIAPDSWEENGGTGQMADFAGGIYVDPTGFIRDVSIAPPSDPLDNLQQMLRPKQSDPTEASGKDWKRPTKLRCVSLRRLSAEWLRRQTIGRLPCESMQNVAGLNRVDFVWISPQRDDVVIAGPFGGVQQIDGWTRDRKTGRSPMQLPFVIAALQAVRNRVPFGCSIDPTNQGIADSLKVANQFAAKTIPIRQAPDAMRRAMGRQNVRVFGTPGNTPLAWLLVEADRHMKQLALGQHPMPDGTLSYLDLIDKHIASGAPSGQLLRLWFTGNPQSIRADRDRITFQIQGPPLRLASENQIPTQAGRRQVAPPDDRIVEFVKQFNQTFPSIADQYPIYGSLESLFRIAAVAELIYQQAGVEHMDRICGPLMNLSANTQPTVFPPRFTDSIAVLHTVRHKRKRHHVLVASGGVLVRPASTLPKKIIDAKSFSSRRSFEIQRPLATDRWWWNAE